MSLPHGMYIIYGINTIYIWHEHMLYLDGIHVFTHVDKVG